MKADPILNKAIILYRKRNYEGALKILKDEEDRYYGSFKYYYLLGVISLYAGNFIEAKENFDSARKIKMNDPSTMLGHAVLYLKRMNTVQAVDYYLNVQEIDPKNKIAKKALEVIRKHSAGEALSEWITEKLPVLFPPVPRPAVNTKTIINGALILTAVLTLTIWLINVFSGSFKSSSGRPTSDFILTSQERSDPVQIEGYYRYVLTRNEALNYYDRALTLFTSYRDEAAKKELNRLLESNASDGLKNRSRLLLNNMAVPGFDTFRRSDNYSYSDIKSEPALYRNVHVIWRGMASNVEITDEYTRFDLLVGYDTRRSLEGIVSVVFYSPVSVSTERPLEVLGKIILTPSYSDFRLEGVAIHQSGRLEN